jgi:hypothetical protein
VPERPTLAQNLESCHCPDHRSVDKSDQSIHCITSAALTSEEIPAAYDNPFFAKVRNDSTEESLRSALLAMAKSHSKKRSKTTSSFTPRTDVAHDWQKDDEELDLESRLFGTSKKAKVAVSQDEENELEGVDDDDVGEAECVMGGYANAMRCSCSLSTHR